MPIDTQKIVDKLTAAGIPRDHAGAIASVFADAAESQHAFNAETLCTKHDLDQAFSGLERRMDVLAERLDGVEERMATKEDLANLRTEIVSSEKRIILWVVGVFNLSQLLPDFLQRMGIV